jgi:hypothetical protein
LLPIKAATGSAIFCHNVLVISGFALTGTGGYLLGRWLFRNHWSGLVLGGILAFNTFTLSNIGQAQLLHLEWLPLVLLYLGKTLQRPTLRHALLLSVFLAAQFYTAVYYGIFSFLIVALVGGVGWSLHVYSEVRLRLTAFSWFAAAMLLAVALCLPLALPYYLLGQRFGFERTLVDAWPFSASLEMWSTPLPRNLIYRSFLSNQLPKLGYYELDSLFPGAILLLMAGAGLAMWFTQGWRTNTLGGGPWRLAARWPILLVVVAVLFFLLSLGPFPQSKSLQPNFEVVLPYAWLHEWVPGFRGLRAPGRFAIIVIFALALAAAYLFRHLHGRTARVGLLALLCVETLALTPMMLFTPSISADQRAAYEWLASQPNSAFLELPLYPFGQEGDEARWLESQFQSINHWHASLGGYSGFFPPRLEELYRFLAGFPHPHVMEFLQAAEIEWLILHRQRIVDEQWAQIEDALQDWGWNSQQWGDVWLVQIPPTKVTFPDTRYYIPESAPSGGIVSVGVIYRSAQPTALVPGSENNSVRVEWRQDERGQLVVEKEILPPFFVDLLAISEATIPVPGATGNYTLRLSKPATGQLLATANVRVVDDFVPPEIALLPVRALKAEISCREETPQLDVLMQTVGWYDAPFTLSARLLNIAGMEVARSSADVEFGVEPLRRGLLSLNIYTLPLGGVPAVEDEHLDVELIAYRWQQEVEGIVARRFVADDGAVLDTIRLPIHAIAGCK